MSYDITLDCRSMTDEQVKEIANSIDPNSSLIYESDGYIIAKNPDKDLIKKMYSAGFRYGISPVGDDGESYDESGHVVILNRWNSLLKSIITRVFRKKSNGKFKGKKWGFHVGQLVSDNWGNECEINEIIEGYNKTFDAIRIKYPDGRILTELVLDEPKSIKILPNKVMHPRS